MQKRIGYTLSLLLTLMTLCVLLWVNAASAQTLDSGTTGEENRLTWVLEDTGTLTISGAGDMTYVYNPEEVPWRSYREEIQKIVIENGVQFIGNYAFQGCSNLTEVTLPDSATYLGDYAFQGCTSLRRIVVPDPVTEVRDSCFSGCTALTEVQLPKNLAWIGGAVFYGCTNLQSLEIPDGVEVLSSSVFGDCTALHTIVLPAQLKVLDISCFAGCIALSHVTLPQGLQTVGFAAFQNCKSLTEIVIPNSVETVDGAAFQGCTALRIATLPEGLNSISQYLFDDCISLTSVNIPESVVTIEDGAFSSCTALQTVVLPDGLEHIGRAAFSDCSALHILQIPDSVKSIESYAFGQCAALRGIQIPDGLTELGISAFDGCSSLERINIPTNATITENPFGYREYFFYGCDSLTEIQVAPGHATLWSDDGVLYQTVNGVTTLLCYPSARGAQSYTVAAQTDIIDDYAFRACNGLQQLTIAAHVSEISNEAFTDNHSIASFVVEQGSANYSGRDDILYTDNATGLTLLRYPGGNERESFTVPAEVTAIGWKAFQGSDNLKELTIPATVTAVDSHTMADCSALDHVNFLASVDSVPSYTFDHSSALRYVVIGGEIEGFQQYSTRGCSSLTRYYIMVDLSGGSATTIIYFEEGNDQILNAPHNIIESLDEIAELDYPDLPPSPGDIGFRFADDNGAGTWSWAGDFIYNCVNRNIISGMENADGTYSYYPEGKLNRAQAATLIARAFYLNIDPDAPSTFTDVEGTANAWASMYIEACADAGIITGRGNGIFDPGANVTRAEMSIMIAKAKGLGTGIQPEQTFVDDTGTGTWSWAGNYIYACQYFNLLSGYPDGTFLPDNSITRAEAAVIISKAIAD